MLCNYQNVNGRNILPAFHWDKKYIDLNGYFLSTDPRHTQQKGIQETGRLLDKYLDETFYNYKHHFFPTVFRSKSIDKSLNGY